MVLLLISIFVLVFERWLRLKEAQLQLKNFMNIKNPGQMKIIGQGSFQRTLFTCFRCYYYYISTIACNLLHTYQYMYIFSYTRHSLSRNYLFSMSHSLSERGQLYNKIQSLARHRIYIYT